jgi:hypothetical protein
LKTVAVAAVARDGRGQQRRVWDAMLESQQLGASAFAIARSGLGRCDRL